MPEEIPKNFCPKCGTALQATDLFCPHCGANVSRPNTGIGAQIRIYLISIFLPPFGYWSAAKYLKQADEKSRKIGWTAVILTSLSIIITIVLSFGVVNSINSQLNQALNGLSSF